MTRVLKFPEKEKNVYNLDDEWNIQPNKKKKRRDIEKTGFYQHSLTTNFFILIFKFFLSKGFTC